jgi:tetratricopeptide (TPR) repeat protein
MGTEQMRGREYAYFCIASLISLALLSCAGMKEASLRKEAQQYLLRGQKMLAQKSYDLALNEFQKVLSLHSQKHLEEEALFEMGLVYAHFGNPKRDYKKSLDLFLKVLNDYPEGHLTEQTKIWVGVLLDNLETTKKLEKLKRAVKDREESKERFKESRRTKPQQLRFEESDEGQDRLLRSQKLLAQGNYEGAVGENQKVLALSDPRSSKDEALFNLGLIYAHSRNPQRDIQRSLDYFKRLIKNYPRSSFVEQANTWVAVLEENEELNHIIEKLKQVDIDIEEMKRSRPQ